MKEKEYKGFKVGMKVIITGYPDAWHSKLNNNYPGYIKFPYICTIKKISINTDTDTCCAMTCGSYGWSLEPLIKSNMIFSIKTIRKEKLKKLNKI